MRTFNDQNKKDLQPQLLGEPFVFASLVPLFELDLGLLSGLACQSKVSEDIFVADSSVQGDIHRVPSGREEILVTNFHERLDL